RDLVNLAIFGARDFCRPEFEIDGLDVDGWRNPAKFGTPAKLLDCHPFFRTHAPARRTIELAHDLIRGGGIAALGKGKPGEQDCGGNTGKEKAAFHVGLLLRSRNEWRSATSIMKMS